MYSNIVNPDNGNVEKTNSVSGKIILRKYINLLKKLSKGQTGGAVRDLMSRETLTDLTIPSGLKAGDQFVVEFPPMRQVRTCPAGKKGGDIMRASPCFLPSDILNDMSCPLSLEIMKDPVITTEGMTYDRESIEVWLQGKNTDPITNGLISLDGLIDNVLARKLISGLCKFRNKHQPDTDDECSPYETDGAATKVREVEIEGDDVMPDPKEVPVASETFADTVLQRTHEPLIELWTRDAAAGAAGTDALPSDTTPLASLINTLNAITSYTTYKNEIKHIT